MSEPPRSASSTARRCGRVSPSRRRRPAATSPRRRCDRVAQASNKCVEAVSRIGSYPTTRSPDCRCRGSSGARCASSTPTTCSGSPMRSLIGIGRSCCSVGSAGDGSARCSGCAGAGRSPARSHRGRRDVGEHRRVDQLRPAEDEGGVPVGCDPPLRRRGAVAARQPTVRPERARVQVARRAARSSHAVPPPLLGTGGQVRQASSHCAFTISATRRSRCGSPRARTRNTSP